MRRPIRLSVLAVVLCATGTARAGRTRFGWLYDTETVPQRGVEIESWLLEEDGKDGTDETLLWWAPVIGLTDRLELAFPVEVAYNRSATTSGVALERFGAEVRWRLVNADPVESGPFAALIRLGAKRLVTERSRARFEADVVLSLDAGPAHLSADLGGVLVAGNGDPTEIEARPAGGVVFRVAGELRLGAELYSELQVRGDGVTWVAAGPTLSFTHGRSWLSASFLVGLRGIDLAPRLNWAIAF